VLTDEERATFARYREQFRQHNLDVVRKQIEAAKER
jgi:hypothetical protein